MIIIDFEASGLNLQFSYPIQVAAIKPDGSYYDSYIKPATNWTYWDHNSQEVHNIPRTLLHDVGRPIRQVANELNEFIGDEIAYCDGGIYDIHWATALYQAANINASWQYGNIICHITDGQLIDDIIGMSWYDWI